MTDPSKVPAPGEAVAWAYTIETVSGSAKFCLVTLALYASLDEDDRWTCWPNRRTLARNIGLSVDRVKQVLRDLERDGLLIREQRDRANGTRTSSRYILAVTPGSPLPGTGEPATPSPGEPATPHEPPIGTTNEPSPVDPRTDKRLPTDVGRGSARRRLPKDVASLTVRILDYWTARTGVTVTGTDVGRGVALRIVEEREHGGEQSPDDEAAWHKRVMDANLAAPWWEGRATPQVLYGNSKAWNAAKARAQGGTSRHRDQDPTRAAAAARDAARAQAAVDALRESENP